VFAYMSGNAFEIRLFRTEKEKAMITPELKPLILRFGRMFEREFAKNTNALEALQILVHEVQKSNSRNMRHKSAKRSH